MTGQPGILALWNDCAEAGETEYERWYMTQHLPERVGVPGFRFGRRYLRLEGDRKYFTFYETDTPDVLWSPEYMQRLGNPTDWTQRVMQDFRNTIRTACRKVLSKGSAMGGHTVTFRKIGAAGPDAVLEQQLQDIILTELSEQKGVCQAHLWTAAEAQTPARTAETDIRGADDMLSWALIFETTFEEDARQLSVNGDLIARIADLAGSDDFDIGIYRLICMMTA